MARTVVHALCHRSSRIGAPRRGSVESITRIGEKHVGHVSNADYTNRGGIARVVRDHRRLQASRKDTSVSGLESAGRKGENGNSRIYLDWPGDPLRGTERGRCAICCQRK